MIGANGCDHHLAADFAGSVEEARRQHLIPDHQGITLPHLNITCTPMLLMEIPTISQCYKVLE
ncbi:Hypothetical predicted protein [Mytilus galloprovincialis]|uniref:Uncharacterized protein n=1 Tax=Mytilus galloprovincialis TaxID=29158 RepID=A0A8B6F8V0_MYTGA|nr:Hypothetical predicted protein [Mytilus galloprovincialis]